MGEIFAFFLPDLAKAHQLSNCDGYGVSLLFSLYSDSDRVPLSRLKGFKLVFQKTFEFSRKYIDGRRTFPLHAFGF